MHSTGKVFPQTHVFFFFVNMDDQCETGVYTTRFFVCFMHAEVQNVVRLERLRDLAGNVARTTNTNTYVALMSYAGTEQE